MGSVYKPTYTKPCPANADIVTQKGEQFVRIKPARGRAKLCPLTVGKDGSPRILVTSAKFVAKYRDGLGIVRTVATGCRDEQAARGRLRELERRSELVRSGVVSAVEDGIADHQSVPLTAHKAIYFTHLKSKGTAELHRRKLSARIDRLFDECRFSKLSDITAERLEQWLLNAEETGLGPRTRNTYRSALVAFCNWAVQSSRLTANPVARVSQANERADRRHQRRSLTLDEIEKLLDATERRPLLEALTVRRGKNVGKPLANVQPDVRDRLVRLGRERRLIYSVLLCTGLRKAELTSIPVNQFHDDAAGAFIELDAADEKNGNGTLIPIRPDLADQLREWIQETTPASSQTDTLRIDATGSPDDPGSRPLLRVPAGLDKIFNRDLELAGIEKLDSRGYVVDPHALRTTFCSMLTATGLPLRMIQLAMRHGSIETSMQHYADPAIHDLHSAVSALPFAKQISHSERALATGTSSELVPVLVPTRYKLSPTDALPVNLPHFVAPDAQPPPVDVTSAPDTRKASLSGADNEAFSERVKGIEPSLEAWEASVLPLNHTRQRRPHYHAQAFPCKELRNPRSTLVEQRISGIWVSRCRSSLPALAQNTELQQAPESADFAGHAASACRVRESDQRVVSCQ
jgi:integrase